MREAAARAAPAHPRGARRRAQGDRAAQPPRLVELPDLPLVRAGRGSARSATSRSSCTAPTAPSACHHCGHREPVPDALRRLRLGLDRPPRQRAPSASSTSSHAAPVFRLDADVGDPARGAGRLRGAPSAACSSARRWSPRATTSPTSTSASCSTPTRRCASPTSAPRSARSRSSPSSPGRAGRGRARRAGARADDRARGAGRSASPPRHDADGFLAGELERRARAALPAVLDADPGRLLLAERPGAAPAARRAGGPRAPAPARSARRRCSACAGASAARSWSRRSDRARGGRAQVGAAVRRGRRGPRAPRRRVQRRRRPAVAYRSRGATCRQSQDSAEHGTSEVAEAPRGRRGASRRPLDPGGRRAPRGGARARAQVRRPGAAGRRRAPVERFDDAPARRGRADGRAHARRAAGSAWPPPRSASCTACSSTASSTTAPSTRSSTR